MTSPDSTPHLSLDALADLLAGEGSDADLAHVGTCAGCAGRLDELSTAEAEVSAVLAALPAPAMPADLADRLSAAFAAEPALQPAPASEGPVALGDGASAVAGGPARVSTGSATVTPFPQARRRRSWLPAAAAVALLLSGGALGTSLLLSGGSEEATSTTTAGDAGGASEPDALAGLARNETGTDYAAEGTLATALPGLLAGSAGPVVPDEAPLAAAEPAEEQAESRSDAAAPTPSPLGETDLRLESQARPDPALDRLRSPEGLASCLAAVLPPDDPSVRPLAVDYAAYQGQPALAVVLPADGAPDKVDVFVVGADCSVGNDATLFFTRLDRPA